MKFLFLSWRDIAAPKKGGAEVFTHEVLKRLVSSGHEVDHISMRPGYMSKDEIIDGVRYLRHGGLFGVIKFAKKWIKNNPGKYDLIVDQCNTHQFFSPLWIPKNEHQAFFIHQLTREIWWHEMRFPFSFIGRIMETPWLRLHRKSPTLTVSNSTADDLRDIGFGKQNKLYILPEGISFKAWEKKDLLPKTKHFTMLYIGRFSKYKGVDDAIRAFAMIRKKHPHAHFWLVGKVSEKYKARLTRLQKKLNLPDGSLVWHGFVSHQKKLELMSSAHCIVVPSQREGWGLVVTEANAVGTIAIGYNSPGLRDSIRHGQTGYLTPHKTPEAIAYMLEKVINNPKTTQIMQEKAHEWAGTFSWDKAGQATEKALLEIVAENKK